MSQLKVTHPDVKKKQEEKRKREINKHDGLHGKYETCYCMNPCCWYGWIHERVTRNGDRMVVTKVRMGICICTSCPCETPRIAGVRMGQ